MRTFNYINRDVVNPVDLTTLSRTYSTLEQGHQQAIKAASDLQTAMASLDLNEAEDAWRQEKINEIKQTISDNTTFGNAYGALDDIIAKTGNLSSDAGMIGRLRAQQDYKTYLETLNKRTDLPEADKEYFREVNKYYYNDKYDAEGNVIGGSKWTPIDQEVSNVPMDKILTQALAWAAKETGGYNQVSFLDAAGNPTTDYKKSATGDIFTKTATGWTKLSKEKLNSAITAAIESIPGAKESIAQDYKIAKWRYDKNGENPDITDKNGILLTPSQYLDKKINPFINAATYYNQTSEIEYGDAVKANIQLSRSGSGSGEETILGVGAADISTTLSNPITIKNIMPAEATGAITANKQIISDLLQLDTDISNLTSNELEEIIETKANKGLLSAVDRLKIYDALDSIAENKEYIDSIVVELDEEERNQFDTYNAIASLSDLPDNEYSKEWANIVNELYDGGQSIRQYFNKEADIDNFYLIIGGKNKAKSLGIIEGSKDGTPYVELPIEYNKSILSFAKAGSLSAGGLFGRAKVKIVGSDGSEHILEKKTKGETHYFASDPRTAYSDLLGYYNNLQRTNDDIIGNSGNLTLSNSIINAGTPDIAGILAIRKSNPENASKYTQVLDDAKDEMFTSLNHIDLVQKGAYSLDKDNTLKEIDSEDRKELTALLRSTKKDNLDIVAIQDPNTGNWGTQITIKGAKDESGEIKQEPITFYVPNGIDSQAYEAWNRNTTFKAKNDINKYKAAGRDIAIATPNLFGIQNHIKLVPNGYGWDVVENGKVLKTINDYEGIAFREKYYNWKETINAITAGIPINENALQNMMIDVAESMATIYSNSPSNELITYYYNCLADVLTK